MNRRDAKKLVSGTRVRYGYYGFRTGRVELIDLGPSRHAEDRPGDYPLFQVHWDNAKKYGGPQWLSYKVIRVIQ